MQNKANILVSYTACMSRQRLSKLKLAIKFPLPSVICFFLWAVSRPQIAPLFDSGKIIPRVIWYSSVYWDDWLMTGRHGRAQVTRNFGSCPEQWRPPGSTVIADNGGHRGPAREHSNGLSTFISCAMKYTIGFAVFCFVVALRCDPSGSMWCRVALALG